MSASSSRPGGTPIVLAYSGGLDTSFLVPWLAEHQRRPVITVTVDTGGIDAAAAAQLAARARALGAIEHHQIDARADYFEQVLRFLIMGNVRRGQLYPLCVGAERVMQAQTIARMARRLGSDVVAHGCTAAGNDQVRFEVALRTLAPDLKVLAPVRDEAFRRADELAYLESRGLPVPPSGARYSVNRGLWGVTIGGTETLTSAGSIPEDAWILTRDAFERAARARAARARVPRRATGRRSTDEPPPRSRSSRRWRGSPLPSASAAASTWATPSSAPRDAWPSRRRPPKCCISAHRELEKLVLTARQQRIKELVAQPYGDLVHEGQLLDPVCRDIEAFLLSLAAARERRRAPAAADRRAVRRGRRVALLAHGRLQGRLRRGGRRVVGGGRARVLAHRRAPGGVLHARRRARGLGARAGSLTVDMRSVVVDKLASVTQACGLSHEVRVATEIPAEEGVVVVVEVLNNKSTYNTLELTSGRMAKVGKGDVVAGALGHRKALFGYSGHVPASVKPGDIIQMLNIGGVLGICDSINPDKGKPFDCRVLGVALTFPYLGERIGVPARVGREAARPQRARSTPPASRWSRSPAPAWRPARPRRPAR